MAFNAPGPLIEICTATATSLAFVRSTVDQDSATGETILSYAEHLSLRVDLQPEGGGYPRFLHGTMTEVNYTAIYMGNADVQTGDRATVSGHQVEVVNVLHYGSEQTELSLRTVR
jgi:hypothetical protein